VALAHRPLHSRRPGLDRRLSRHDHLQPPTPLFLHAISRAAGVRSFAAGRVQSVGAAGEPRVPPSVRWDGPLGRRRHSRTTRWASCLRGTVRIGAGAGRFSPALLNAAHRSASLTSTPHDAASLPGTERIPKSHETKTARPTREPGSPRWWAAVRPLKRVPPLHSVALRTPMTSTLPT
jgi:hypothetical protein